MNGDLLKKLSFDLGWVKRFKKEAIGGALIVLASLLFYKFAYLWFGAKYASFDAGIKGTRAEISRINAEIQAAESLRTAVKEASVNLKAIEQRLREMKERLPSDRYVSKILSEISDNDFKRGVRIVSIKPLAPEDKGELARLPFQITLEGRYFTFGDYIERIENLPRVMVVDNFTIEPKDEATSVLTTQVYLSAYVLNYNGRQ